MSQTPPPRQAYTGAIHELEHDLLEMGSLAESMVAQAVEALCGLDTKVAFEVMGRDDEVDRRELEIEERCIRLLALQQPIAGDLRVVGTAIKMITDIERVADLAVDLAKIAVKVERELGAPNCIDIPRLANLAILMFRESLEAYVRRDLEKVAAITRHEEEADQLYRELRSQIFEAMQREPSQAVVSGWLFLALHHLERIADHAVNVAERVHYMVTGEHKPLGRPEVM